MERYKILEEIGKGSFGVVFKAESLQLNMIVAVKIIKRIQDGRMCDLKSMNQECQILKNLKHPNIVHLLEFFETEKEFVVVTEYAPMDLYTYLSKEQLLQVDRVQSIACNLVSALYYLHSHRILHRDIKPQNILMGTDGSAKVCDFGFARTMSVDQFMLTSFKGTPLYMAPEIIQGKPYDHNADLWSMGCILYELVVGQPPFPAEKMIELYQKVKSCNIFWPEAVSGDCLSFLKGLLKKNPEDRLSWPDLLYHSFVKDGVEVETSNEQFSLTKVLSPSQELAKEQQRQNLERKLANYSHMLVRAKKKYEETQRRLKKCNKDALIAGSGVPVPFSSPRSQAVLANANNIGVENIHLKHGAATKEDETSTVIKNLSQLKLEHKDVVHQGKIKGKVGSAKKDEEWDSGSSCETISSSESGSDESEDRHTVIMEGSNKSREKRKDGTACDSGNISLEGKQELKGGVVSEVAGSGNIWRSVGLFTIHSLGSDDKPIMSEEWVSFIVKTMKEVMENPKCLCEKHFLTVVVAPLRNHLAGPEVVEKIATLLSVPFATEKSENDDEKEDIIDMLKTTYLDNKVLPNLLYASKLIIQRRRVERNASELSEIASILTVEDLDALDKCSRLVCFLVHTDEDFVTQFCDSICVLRAFALLRLFLKLDRRKSRLAAECIAILCHVMRTVPTNVNIVEELFLVNDSGEPDKEKQAEFWRLLQHPNPAIQARALRVLGYLAVHSNHARTLVIRKHCSKLWRTLQQCNSSLDRNVSEAAAFCLDALRHLPLMGKMDKLKTEKSMSHINPNLIAPTQPILAKNINNVRKSL